MITYTRARRLGSVALAVVTGISAGLIGSAVAQAATTPEPSGTYSITGECPYSYNYVLPGNRDVSGYNGVTVAGHTTGLTAGATYAVYARPLARDQLDVARWLTNVTADSSGQLDFSVRKLGAVPTVFPDLHGDTVPYGVVISSIPGKSGDAYPVAPGVPGQVTTYLGKVRVNDGCNPWTLRGSKTFGVALYPRMMSITQRYSVDFLPHGTRNVRTARSGDLALVKWSGTGGSATQKVIWKVSKPGAVRLVMQADGNLVLYSRTNKALWQTRTSGHPGDELVVQRDGNLVIYSAGPTHKALWQSRTNGR